MASYDEIAVFRQSGGYTGLLPKIAVAVSIKAAKIVDKASPTSPQQAWAKEALANPYDVAKTVISYVLAANNTATMTQITSASDSAIQTNVDDAVDKLFGV